MSELYIFSQDDNFITILTEDEGLVDTWFKDYQNHIPDESFVFNVDSNSPLLQHITEENQIAFYDRDGDLRLVRIKELYEVTTKDGHNIRVKCEPSYLELYDHFIEDKRITNGNAQTALNRALEGSRYVGEVTVELGLATDNFYWIDGIGAVYKVLNTWGGALKDTIALNDGNEIIERKLWIVQRLGTDNGLIVEPDYNAEQISRKTLSYIETALWGQGSSLETDNNGYTRYITFEDVEWKVSNGDPVDKPFGQKWVGDPQALAEHGYLHNGVRKHRFGHFSNQDYETPEELLWATWQELQERKLKEIIHEATIYESDKKVSLGDTVTILDRNYNKPIELQSQITGLEYDILDDNEIVIIIGKYIDMSENSLQKDVDVLKEQVKKPRPTEPINNGSFPDIKPGTPANVTATGLFQTIQLFWDYDSNVYISHYEVYGSQISDFVPDEQHLLYRGNVSAFNHEVKTDEIWYYYIRAVNTRGTVGEFSNRVNASSIRVISDDILFGSIVADHLADGLDLANKLSDGTLDWINNEPLYQIEEMNSRLLGQIDNKVEIVDYQNAMIDVNEELNKINLSVVDVQGKYDEAVAQISAIDLKSDNISLSVSELTTDFNNLEIGGRNLISVEGFQVVNHVLADASNYGEMIDNKIFKIYDNPPNGTAFLFKAIKVEHGQEYTLNADMSDTISSLVGVVIYDKSGNILEENGLISGDLRWVSTYRGYQIHSDGVLTPPYRFKIEEERVGFVRVRLGVYRGNFTTRDVLIREPKLEKGNKATDWAPAPEDMADKAQLISYINLSTEGIRIHGERVHISGQTLIDDAVIGTAAIADAAISRVKLGTAVIGTAQIDDLAVSSAKIAKLAVDDSHIANLSVTKLLAGEIDTDKIKIRGGSAIDYTLIDGSYFESRGRFTRTWRGSTRTHDIKLRFQNGYLRARNDSEDRSLYYSDNGISTAIDGSLNDSASGTLEFFDTQFSSARGVTLHSHFGVVALQSNGNRVITDAYLSNNIESSQSSVYIRPQRNVRSGNNVFQFYVKDNSSVVDTDGVIYYGSDENDVGAGLRFSKESRKGEIHATDHTGDKVSGSFHAKDFVGTHFIGSLRAPTTNIYAQTAYDGEFRVTDKNGYNNGNMTFRPVVALDFRPQSSERIKTEINQWEDNILDTIVNDMTLYQYRLTQNLGTAEDRIRHGLIIERETPSSIIAGTGVDLYEYTTWAMKGLQEAGTKLRNHDDEISWLKTEYQFLLNENEQLKYRVKQLEEKAA